MKTDHFPTNSAQSQTLIPPLRLGMILASVIALVVVTLIPTSLAESSRTRLEPRSNKESTNSIDLKRKSPQVEKRLPDRSGSRILNAL